jgi:hypothetical protein
VRPRNRADKAHVLFPDGLPTSELVRYGTTETIFSQGQECTPSTTSRNKFRRLAYIHYNKTGRLEVHETLAKVFHD